MRLVTLGLLILIGFAGSPAQAQDKFPSKPITILLGYPPGGSTDTTARAIAPVLERILGQPVVIQNRPGAAALIGTMQVANATPDGYTVTVATTQLSLLPAVDQVFGRPPSFTREQFAPIALVSADPSMLFVNATQPWKNFGELVADAKKRPGQIVYASGGLYGTTHLAVEIVLKATGTRMRHLPTAGGGPSLTAVLGNHAQLLAAHPAVGGPQARAGVLRPDRHHGDQAGRRLPGHPDPEGARLRRPVLSMERPVHPGQGAGADHQDLARSGGQGGEGSGLHQGDGEGRQRHRLSRP